MSKLLIDEYPLTVQPSLAVAIGLNEAIILQQVQYWLNVKGVGVERDGVRWVYNTLAQWQEQFPFWSIPTIKRTMASLRKSGLLVVEQHNAKDWDHKNYYTIDRDALNRLILSTGSKRSNRTDQIDPIEEVKLIPSHTETTTETTSENNMFADAHCARARAGTREAKELTLLPAEKMPDAVELAFEAWNNQSAEIGLPVARELTPQRRKAIAARLKQIGGLSGWDDLLSEVRTSDYLCGKVKPWRVTLDWVVKPSNMQKVRDGAYANHKPQHPNAPRTRSERAARAEEIERVDREVFGSAINRVHAMYGSTPVISEDELSF